MSQQVLPLVFAGGMDQNNNTIVGPPGIQRLERARFVEPGNIAISNGYQWATGFSFANGMRQVFQVGQNRVLVASDGSGNYSVKTLAPDGGVVSRNYQIPAVEAPYRIIFNPSLTTAYVPPKAGDCVRVSRIANGDSIWTLFATWNTSVSTLTAFGIFSGTKQISSGIVTTPQGNTQNFGVAQHNRANNERWAWSKVGAYIHLLQLAYSGYYSWSVYRVFSNAGYNGLWLRDAACSTPASGNPSIYFLADDNNVYGFETGSSTTLTPFGVAVTGGATGTPIGIAAFGNYLVRITTTGWCKAFRLSTGLGVGSEIQTVSGSYSAINKATIGAGASTEEYCAAVEETHTYGTRCVALVQLTNPGGAGLSAGGTYRLGHASLCGRPFIRENRWYVPIMDDCVISRTFRVQDITEQYSNRSLVFAAQGEMPTATQIDCGTTAVGATQFCESNDLSDLFYFEDPILATNKRAAVFAFSAVNSGNLTGSNCVLNASALVVPVDTLINPVLGLQPIPVDGNHSIVSAGIPWLEGADTLAAGYKTDFPRLVLVEGAAGSTFPTGAVYQYSFVFEHRDASGNYYRSAPAQPLSIIPSVGRATIDIQVVLVPFEFPGSTGIIRIYRTTTNGTVFYDTGLTITTPSGDYVVSDATTDANLINGTILYTQAQNAFGGLKPKYGVPPHRFGARGKDRIAVGGIERANRIRWSLTFFPGEGVAFPHPSEAGWFQDFPAQELTAVWALDDAWVIASRDRIWLVYGQGPDDNGQNGSFEPPRLISANRGVITHKSLCEIPEGLLFQAEDSQIYLLVRGQYQVVWFSSQVKNELFDGLVNGRVLNPIVGAVYNESLQTVHFWRWAASGLDSSPLVYDIRMKSWSLDGDGISNGLTGCLSAGAIRIPGPTGVPTPTVASVTDDKLTWEIVDRSYTGSQSPSGASWQATLTTNDFAPFGFGGWGRVQTVGAIVGLDSGNALLGLSLWRNRRQGIADESAFLTETEGVRSEEYPQLTHAVNLDKMSALRVAISWTGKNIRPAGLVMQLESEQRAERTGTSKRT